MKYQAGEGKNFNQDDYVFTATTLTSGVDTLILTDKKSESKQRYDCKIQAKGDGTGNVYLKFDNTQTDDEALLFKDNVFLAEDLADTLSNYSGSVYIKADNPITITVWEAVKQF